MKMSMLAGTTVLTVTLLSVAVNAQNLAASDGPGQFRFHLEESNTPRGKAVEGYIYNDSPWRITNVRLRVQSVDANGTVTNESSGWVVGDVKASGRSYFYVPVTAHAASYRASVQSFDKIALDEAQPEAP